MLELRVAAGPVTLNCDRIALMTKDESLVSTADSLTDAVTNRLQSLASRVLHPSRSRSGLDYLEVSTYLMEVDGEFDNIAEVARERLAVTPDGK